MGLGRYCILFSAKPNFGFYFDAFPRWQKWSGTDSGKYSILELQGCSYFASDLFVVCFSQNLPLPTQIKTTRISLLNTSEYLWGGLNIPQRYRANFTCHATILAGRFFRTFWWGVCSWDDQFQLPLPAFLHRRRIIRPWSTLWMWRNPSRPVKTSTLGNLSWCGGWWRWWQGDGKVVVSDARCYSGLIYVC